MEAVPESHLRFLAGQVLVPGGPGDEVLVASAALVAVANAWPSPVRRDTPPDLRMAICAALPFTGAAAVIEGLSGWGEDIQLHLYGWPWVNGERWPAAIPSFTVSAIDDLGGTHDGRPGAWRGYGDGEGHGDFTFWPTVPTGVTRLHVVVSTLWETAWADIELPHGRAWPGLLLP